MSELIPDARQWLSQPWTNFYKSKVKQYLVIFREGGDIRLFITLYSPKSYKILFLFGGLITVVTFIES